MPLPPRPNNPNLPTMKNPPPPPKLDYLGIIAKKAMFLKKPTENSINFILYQIDFTARNTLESQIEYEAHEISKDSIDELRKRGFEVKEYTYLFFWKRVKISW